MGVTAKRTPAIFATFAAISLTSASGSSATCSSTRRSTSAPSQSAVRLAGARHLAAVRRSVPRLDQLFLTRFPLFQVWQPASELELQGIDLEQRYATGDLGGADSRPE
jgi:hypothetical protein